MQKDHPLLAWRSEHVRVGSNLVHVECSQPARASWRRTAKGVGLLVLVLALLYGAGVYL